MKQKKFYMWFEDEWEGRLKLPPPGHTVENAMNEELDRHHWLEDWATLTKKEQAEIRASCQKMWEEINSC